MSVLTERKTVDIAEADWTDDGEVELLTFPTPDGHRTHMLPGTARALARQLLDAARAADKAAGESGVQRAHRTAQHGFDVDTLAHDWRQTIGGPVCSRCGYRVTTTNIQQSCPGPLEAPGVRP